MNNIRRSIARIAVLLASLASPGAHAAELQDDFSTNPFGTEDPPSPQRWCERFHHVHWIDAEASPIHQTMIGVDGTCCQGIAVCGCGPLQGVGGSCGAQTCDGASTAVPIDPDASDWPNCRHLLITSDDYDGDERRATVAFSVPEQLWTSCDAACGACPGEQVKLAVAAHPNCEATVEARVLPKPGDATKQALQIRVLTTPRAGFPECGSSLVEEVSTIDAVATLTLEPSATPRYELSISITRSSLFPGTKLSAVAELYDRDTDAVVATASKSDFARPDWYNREGKRFAIGGLSFPKPSGQVVFDDFDGEAHIVPPDPQDPQFPNGAPVTIDVSVATTVKESTAFLYDPADPGVPTIQTAYDDPQGYIDPSTIAPRRAAVIRGKVLDEEGESLPGISVTILEHREFGRTHSRLDGQFDMAVNGGGSLTVVYEKEGYLTAQRRVDVPWQDSVTAPDVVLIEKDPVASDITLSALSDIAVHRATTVSDQDGTRRASLLFFPGTTALMETSAGTLPLDQATVRATEYTVGNRGLERMPAELPPNTAYTYALELSIDQADARGATRVTFSQPVVLYVENFLNLPLTNNEGGVDVPVTVPLGYYDRQAAVWVPADSGQIVSIVGWSGTPPVAEVDTDGDGSADNLGIALDERRALAGNELYGLEQLPLSLWRLSIPHFSAWDANLPYWPPEGSGPCNGCKPRPEDDDDDEPDTCSIGSRIGCQSQVLNEAVDVVGTPFRLHYQSDRVRGRASARTIRIPLRSSTPPALTNLRRIELEIAVAGQKHRDTIQLDFENPQLPTEPYTFVWDGLDAYGREVQGRVPATVRVGYTYKAQYGRTTRFLDYPVNAITGTAGRWELTFWEEYELSLLNRDARGIGLGGWTFHVHHSYDVHNGVVLLGDGRTQVADPRVITTVAGGGMLVDAADGTAATDIELRNGLSVTVGPDGSTYTSDLGRLLRVDSDGLIENVAGAQSGEVFNGEGPAPALDLALGSPAHLAFGPDGSLYLTDAFQNRLRRIYEEDGALLMKTIAGASPCTHFCPGGFSGDGGPATNALLSGPGGLAVGPEGAVYFADRSNRRVRRVSTDGIITTIAGNGTAGYSPDGTTGADAALEPQDVAIGPDGNLYVLERPAFYQVGAWARLRRLNQVGKLETVAGLPSIRENPPEGGVARDHGLNWPQGISIGPDGSIFIEDTMETATTGPVSLASLIVRRISPDGFITTIAGNGEDGFWAFGGDGGPARLAALGWVTGTASAPDGGLVIANPGVDRIRKVGAVSPDNLGNSIYIPSRDGREIYVFDLSGRHLSTRDAWTNAVVWEFDYDANGRLLSITDRSGNLPAGNVTTITHPAWGGYPPLGQVLITAPGGQQTTLTLDGENDGYLKSIANPAAETYLFGYTTTGLLTELTDPRGSRHEFGFDPRGRLIRDANPEVLAVDPNGAFKTLARTDDSPRKFTVALTSALGRTWSYAVESLLDDTILRANTDPAGLVETLSVAPDARRVVTTKEDVVIDMLLGPDPRLGMAAPMVMEAHVMTPQGLHAVVNQSRTATPSDVVQPLASASRAITINGRPFARTYDGATRTITDESPEGRRRHTKLDVNGKVVETEVEGIYPVALSYDDFGRLTSIRQGPPGGGSPERVYSLEYDEHHRVTSIIDPVLRVVGFGNFDGADRAQTIMLPDLEQVGLGYDNTGKVTSVTPPGRPSHQFDYNAVGLERLYTPPQVSPPIADRETEVGYDLDRQADVIARPSGELVDAEYDPVNGRLLGVALPAGQGGLEYLYDPPTGQIASVIGPSEGANRPKVSFSYNGPLLRETTWSCENPPCPSGTIEGSVEHVYDDDFRRASQTVKGGSQVIFGYDQDDLLTGAGALDITRDTDPGHGHGLIRETQLGLVTDSYTYNDFGEVETYTASYDGTPIFEVTYPLRDALGRILQKTERIEGGPLDTYEYTYDARGRLDTVTKNSVPVADYDYDANGNRTAAPNLTTPPAYDSQDRLCVYGDTTYLYTDNGELLLKTEDATGQIGCGQPGAGATTQYVYDSLGNLRQVVLPSGQQVEYVVDGVGRRVGKKVNGILVQGFLYENQLRIAAELNANGTIRSRFVYGNRPNIPEYLVQEGITYRILSDDLGSPRLVIQVDGVGAGAIVQRMGYDEFGRLEFEFVDQQFQRVPFGFAGGLYDPLTGLLRFGARDYDTTIGRWTAKDPLRFMPGDVNLYGYALGDPVNRIDPTGLLSLDCFNKNFWRNLNETNDFFFKWPTNLARTALGALTAGQMARSTGLTSLGMALRGGLGGVANLGLLATAGSVLANSGANALAVAAALEAGIWSGSAASALGQALAGLCPPECEE